jgi:hypothetical protein
MSMISSQHNMVATNFDTLPKDSQSIIDPTDSNNSLPSQIESKKSLHDISGIFMNMSSLNNKTVDSANTQTLRSDDASKSLVMDMYPIENSACIRKSITPNPKLSRQFYKTRMCPFHERGHCRRSEQCTYAHSEAELKIAPDLYKTKLCENWQKGFCTEEANCRFAHGRQELRFTSHVYKTRLCHFWLTAECSKGRLCRHAHGVQELQIDSNLNFHSNKHHDKEWSMNSVLTTPEFQTSQSRSFTTSFLSSLQSDDILKKNDDNVVSSQAECVEKVFPVRRLIKSTTYSLSDKIEDDSSQQCSNAPFELKKQFSFSSCAPKDSEVEIFSVTDTKQAQTNDHSSLVQSGSAFRTDLYQGNVNSGSNNKKQNNLTSLPKQSCSFNFSQQLKNGMTRFPNEHVLEDFRTSLTHNPSYLNTCDVNDTFTDCSDVNMKAFLQIFNTDSPPIFTDTKNELSDTNDTLSKLNLFEKEKLYDPFLACSDSRQNSSSCQSNYVPLCHKSTTGSEDLLKLLNNSSTDSLSQFNECETDKNSFYQASTEQHYDNKMVEKLALAFRHLKLDHSNHYNSVELSPQSFSPKSLPTTMKEYDSVQYNTKTTSAQLSSQNLSSNQLRNDCHSEINDPIFDSSTKFFNGSQSNLPPITENVYNFSYKINDYFTKETIPPQFFVDNVLTSDYSSNDNPSLTQQSRQLSYQCHNQKVEQDNKFFKSWKSIHDLQSNTTTNSLDKVPFRYDNNYNISSAVLRNAPTSVIKPCES